MSAIGENPEMSPEKGIFIIYSFITGYLKSGLLSVFNKAQEISSKTITHEKLYGLKVQSNPPKHNIHVSINNSCKF
jgi:hypothetical protein